jgi:ArsR family transcriptional regulator
MAGARVPTNDGPNVVAMKKKQEFQDCANRLKAIADPDRLRIVNSLFLGAKHVTQLAEELGDDVVKTSHHLGVLRHAGVVQAEKQGRFVVYRLHPDVIVADEATGDLHLIDFGCCSVNLR